MAAVNGGKEWIKVVQGAKKSSLLQDGRKKVHFLFEDGKEMVEEYDVNNGQLLVRKWKTRSTLGAQGKWDFEIGEPGKPPLSVDGDILAESNSNPTLSRRDTPTSFQWRIRNLPYELKTYLVNVDDSKEVIIIKTTNKKYYKKVSVPDMQRCKLPLEQSALSIAHANNTLIVTYKKPKIVLDMEKELQIELKKIKSDKDGDVECNQS